MKAQPPLARPAAGQWKRTWVRLLLIVFSAVPLLAILLPLTLFALFTSGTDLALPETNVAQEDRDDLTRRWLDFQDAIKTEEGAAPFKFSSRDLNVFVDMMPRLRSCVRGVFEASRLQVQFCQPLPIGTKTRYVKGTATIIPIFKDRQLAIRVVSCRVNGHALPGWICRQLGRRSLNPEAFEILERFDVQPHLQSIEARDDCLVITPRHSEPAHE